MRETQLVEKAGDPALRVDARRSIAKGFSLSGNERNQLFRNERGRGFSKVSGLSGADDPADGRSVAVLDYDRDGWADLAAVNANTPLFELFRNQAAGWPSAAGNGFVAVRLVGGNRTAAPSPQWSNRDGIGATVSVELADAVLVREQRAGDGLAAQNSATLLFGIGKVPRANRLHVRWPSGREQSLADVPAGSLVTAFEDETASPDGSGFTLAPYARAVRRPPEQRLRPLERLPLPATNGGGPPLRLVTTMATWCAICLGELPQLALLRKRFPRERLALVGLPADEEDSPEKLAAYIRANAPAYELLIEPGAALRREAGTLVRRALRIDALPATFVTDAGGLVLETRFDVPSVSEVRRWLAEMDASAEREGS